MREPSQLLGAFRCQDSGTPSLHTRPSARYGCGCWKDLAYECPANSKLALNRIVPVLTMKDTIINKRAQTGITPNCGVGKATIEVVVARHTARPKAKGRCR